MKHLEHGNMSVSCPTNWTSENQVIGDIGKLIMITDGDKPNNVYCFYEYNLEASVDYIMANTVVNNPNVLFKDAEWGPIQTVQFNGMDARRTTYTKTLFNVLKDGIVYAFCKGKRSYVILYLRDHGTPDKSQDILRTYRLTGNEDEQVSYATAYEEITHFIASMKASGAIGRASDDGVILKDMVAHANPKELEFTYQVDFIDKSQLDHAAIEELKREWRVAMKQGLKEQIAQFAPYARCCNDGFLFTIHIIDVKATNICVLQYFADELK
ncbi:MAG: hypothetical protein IJ159_06620 [Prevotella sp.]|nr:hypothetical protein [Prevotella sp.]